MIENQIWETDSATKLCYYVVCCSDNCTTLPHFSSFPPNSQAHTHMRPRLHTHTHTHALHTPIPTQLGTEQRPKSRGWIWGYGDGDEGGGWGGGRLPWQHRGKCREMTVDCTKLTYMNGITLLIYSCAQASIGFSVYGKKLKPSHLWFRG